jgi:iron complex outermembrane recepter protein
VVAPAAGQLSPLAGPVLVGEPVEVLARREPASPATATTLVLETAPIRPAAALPALASETGGFFVADSGGRSFTDTFALRGLVNTPLFGEPALTVYLDGIPLGSTFTFPTELTGFALAELHRGPSAGTTFGRAGPGGVLALLTPAGHRSAGGDARIGFGSHGTRMAEVTGSLGDRRRRRCFRGRRLPGARRLYHQLHLAGGCRSPGRPLGARPPAHPADGYGRADPAGDGLAGPRWRATPRSAGRAALHRRTQLGGLTHADARHAGLTGAFLTPVGRLAATTAYTDWELGPYWNTLNFGFAELENGSTLRQRMWSEEITLAADPQAARPWRVGLFGADTTTDGAFIRAFSGFTFEESSYRIDSRNLAAFGEATWPLTAAVEMSAGLRVEETRRDLDRREQIPTSSVIQAHHRSSALLPHLALNYAWDPATTLFARVGAGYKPGGFSAFTGNPELTTFAAERTRSLETGVTHAPTGATSRPRSDFMDTRSTATKSSALSRPARKPTTTSSSMPHGPDRSAGNWNSRGGPSMAGASPWTSA